MAAFLDLCRFIASAGGTADWTYSATVSPYISPVEAGAVNGRTYKVRAESADLTQWEVSEGAYSTASGSFGRTTILYNSAGTGTKQSGAGTKVSFNSAPQVWVVASKLDLLSIEEDNAFTDAQKAQARANIDVVKKNYVINGAMMVSQENGSIAGTISGYYPVDGFSVSFNHAGAISAAQIASVTPAGSPNRLRVTVTAADASVGATDYLTITHKIEGFRMANLRFGLASAKTVTLQFGCKAPAGTYCVSLRNAAANRAYVGEFTIAAGEANSDLTRSITLTGDSSGTWAKDNTAGVVVDFVLMAGSNYQSSPGSWQTTAAFASANQLNFMATNGNVFELFDVGLHEGAAPSFQVPDYASELALARRYWQASYANGTPPGTITITGQIRRFPDSTNSFACIATVFFNPPMRAAPSVTLYSPGTGATGKIRNADAGIDVNGAAADACPNSVTAYVSNVSIGQSTTLTVHYKADARL
jgi:hypothetical protein